jgi:hypothetical protein
MTPSSTIRLGLVTVPSNRAGRLISTLDEALIVPLTDPDITTMFAFMSALITAPSEIISVSLENILPFTYPAIRTVPLNERFPSNLQPSSIMAHISLFLLRQVLRFYFIR